MNSFFTLPNPNLPLINCHIEEYVGDGICDDLNNHEKCNFDGGDCCGGTTQFCVDCFCHAFNEETEVNPSMTPSFVYNTVRLRIIKTQFM